MASSKFQASVDDFVWPWEQVNVLEELASELVHKREVGWRSCEDAKQFFARVQALADGVGASLGAMMRGLTAIGTEFSARTFK